MPLATNEHEMPNERLSTTHEVTSVAEHVSNVQLD
jgi:hypothetical protein